MLRIIKIIVLSLSIVTAQHISAQQTITFIYGGLKDAQIRAKAENKPLLLWCYATWCPHCKYMKEKVFNSRSVADFYNKTFICVSQDMEKDDGPELNKELKINSYPTFIFYMPDGTFVYRIEGEYNPDTFVAEGKNAQNPKNQLPYLKQQFEKDVSNSTNCYNYLRVLKKGGMDFSSVVNNYFVTQSDKQLLSEVNWRIFSNGISDFSSRVFQFVIMHQNQYADIASPERVHKKLNYEVKALLSPLVEITDTINYPLKRELAAQIHSYSTDSLIFTFDLRMWELAPNWQKYTEICLLSTESFAWNNHTQLSNIAGNILKHSSDKMALQQAIRWANRSLILSQSYDNYMLCARINQKLNNKTEAISMAQKADNLARKFGWEGVEAQKLLQELDH